MKRMLVNATQPEEVRIAITDGNSLFDLDIENIAEVRRCLLYTSPSPRD